MKTKHNEKEFLEYLENGTFCINERGEIYRMKGLWGYGKNKKEKIIKPKRTEVKNGLGYLKLQVKDKGKKKFCVAHRLVWLYFFGEIPNELTINHKNGIKTDNRPENLELMTQKENNRHARETGLCVAAKGEKVASSKLKSEQVVEIKKMLKERKIRQVQIAKKFNITAPMISYIKHGRTWKHI